MCSASVVSTGRHWWPAPAGTRASRAIDAIEHLGGMQSQAPLGSRSAHGQERARSGKSLRWRGSLPGHEDPRIVPLARLDKRALHAFQCLDARSVDLVTPGPAAAIRGPCNLDEVPFVVVVA